MSTSFSRTRNQIVQTVLSKVIKIGAQTPTSADNDTVAEALDLRLKSLHEMGIYWRKVTTVPVTFSLTAGVASASVGGDILFPIKATWTNGSNDDPVDIINYVQYAEIEDKGRTGSPTKMLWKGGTEVVFYPVPSASGTAKLLYEKIADDTVSSSAVDVDVAMIGSLITIIKCDVADHFGIPETTIARWEREARRAEIAIRKLGAPRVDYAPVPVDDFDGRVPNSRRESDY